MIMRYYMFFLFVMGLYLISFSCKEDIKEKSTNTKDSFTTKSVSMTGVTKTNLWQNYSYKEREGLKLYDKYCAICHGSTGKGDGFNAYNLDPHPANLADSSYMAGLSDESINKIISYGGLSVNRSVLMPAYENTLSSYQINSIISYIRKLSGN